MKSVAELTERFHQRGLKMTPQRQCILEVLSGNDAHPTAESVYAAARAAMPSMSLKTVYQTLNDLAAMGEIQQLDLGTGSSRFDPNVDAHHHVVCRRCGTVADVYVEGTEALALDDLHGFAIDSSDIVFHGTCAACAAV